MVNVDSKTVLVLGGAGGIGTEICRSLIAQKVGKLAVIDVVEDVAPLLGDAVKRISLKYRKASVDNQKVLEKAMQELSVELGGFDIIINSVAIVRENDPAQTVAVNLGGTINSTLNGIELMRKDKGGRGGVIVNIASVAGLNFVFPMPVYSATKHGVLAFTKSLQNDVFFAKTGVSFRVICPGATQTRLIEDIVTGFQWPEFLDEAQRIVQTYPSQDTPVVAKCVLKAIEDDENGGVWQVENNRIEKIAIHKYPLFL